VRFVSGGVGPKASLPLASQLVAPAASFCGSWRGRDHAATLASPAAPLQFKLGSVSSAKGFEPAAHFLLSALVKRRLHGGSSSRRLLMAETPAM
jgi:hypothetical protein